jgi:formate dehydrogenase
LEAQKRYADGIKNCLVKFLNGQPIERDYIIVDDGKVVSPSYSYAFKK